MLAEMKRDCLVAANRLGNYQTMSIDVLANKYCEAKDANDSENKDTYFSALLLRFWYTIDKLYQKSKSANIERDECFAWLVEAIEYACKYRAWQDPTKNVNAQQAINKCIATIRLQKYYDFNLDKHRVNQTTISLETPLDNEDGKSLGDILEGENLDDTIADKSDAECFIQDCVDKKQIVEAIILDSIAFNDTYKHSKRIIKTSDQLGNPYKYVEHSSEFWPYRVIQVISQLPQDYNTYFLNKYSIAANELDVALSMIRKANNQKLYRYLRKTLENCKSNLSSFLNA